jgi:hypothetical protein
MAKSLNQNFYSSTIYGSEAVSGDLTLQSTSSPTLGIIKLIGTSFDFIINNQIARFTHSNTELRTYSLPDADGPILASSIFTAANQMLYSSASNASTVLDSVDNSILSTSDLGIPTWLTGTENQFLQIVGGKPVFAALPATIGRISNSVGQTLPIYDAGGPSNQLIPLSTVSGRILASPAGTLTWDLLNASYLAGTGYLSLGAGTLNQKLVSNGDSTFKWVDDPAVINPGERNFLSYYSTPSLGTTISSSSFISTTEATSILSLLNDGKIRLYQPTLDGNSYVQLVSPNGLSAPITFALPALDGAAGEVLATDGFGNLNFVPSGGGGGGSGTVTSALENQLSYYAADGNTVEGLTTVAERILNSDDGGVPTWGLIKPKFLAASGDNPLDNGTQYSSLISNGDGTFSWATVANIISYILAYWAPGASKVFLTDNSGSVSFDLIAEKYLKTTGGTALSGGTVGKVLTSDGSGNFVWSTGGGGGSGTVNSGLANQLTYYASNGTTVQGLTTTSNRLLSSASGGPTWILLSESYLTTTGGGALTGGTAGEVLTSDGSGNFVWSTGGGGGGNSDIIAGSVSVPSGTSSVTVTYASALSAAATSINVTWSIEGVADPVQMPTLAVYESTETGFVVKFPTTTVHAYKLYWMAFK